MFFMQKQCTMTPHTCTSVHMLAIVNSTAPLLVMSPHAPTASVSSVALKYVGTTHFAHGPVSPRNRFHYLSKRIVLGCDPLEERWPTCTATCAASHMLSERCGRCGEAEVAGRCGKGGMPLGAGASANVVHVVQGHTYSMSGASDTLITLMLPLGANNPYIPSSGWSE
jgi:hypothetical protein